MCHHTINCDLVFPRGQASIWLVRRCGPNIVAGAWWPMRSAHGQGPGTDVLIIATELVKALYSVLEWSWSGREKGGATKGQFFSAGRNMRGW